MFQSRSKRFFLLSSYFLLCFLLGYFSVSIAANIPTEIPPYINYQGTLTRISDNIAVNERLTMIFSIYNVPAIGTALYKQKKVVAINNGQFTVVLGEGEGWYGEEKMEDGIPIEVFVNNNQLYVGVQIEGHSEMYPRQKLISVSYAYKAEMARKAKEADSALMSKTSENVMGQVTVNPSTGNVGIGTTSPTENLEVSGNIKATGIVKAVSFEGDGSGLTGIRQHSLDASDGDPQEALFVDSEGNVGIGTNGPKEKLDVDGSIRMGYGQNFYSGDKPVFRLDSIGNNVFFGTGSEGNYMFYGNNMEGWGHVNTGPLSVNGHTYFSGNVGIGSTLTDKLLTLDKITVEDPTIRIKNSGEEGEHYLDIAQGYNSYIVGTHKLFLGTSGINERLTILENGNVGIGTMSPGKKLDVSGDLKANSILAGYPSSSSGYGNIVADYDVIADDDVIAGDQISANSLNVNVDITAGDDVIANDMISAEEGKAILWGTSEGAGSLDLKGSSGNTIAKINHLTNYPNNGYLNLLYNGSSRARLYVSSSNAGFLNLRGGSGNTIASLSYLGSYPDNGYLGLHQNGSQRIWLYVNENNAGKLTLANGSGQSTIWLNGENGTKNFVMDHPKDPNKVIVYTSIESPEAAVYTRGTVNLINGEATVNFEDHFIEVINLETITVQVTPISSDSEGLSVIEKSELGFKIRELHNGKGNYGVDYLVQALRKGFEDFKPVRTKERLNSMEVETPQDGPV